MTFSFGFIMDVVADTPGTRFAELLEHALEVFQAVGQPIARDVFGDAADEIEQKGGKLLLDEDRKTSLPNVWAGGDCRFGSDDLTVSAVQDGKLAAIAIDRQLRAEG